MRMKRRTLRATLGWIYAAATGLPLVLLAGFGLYYASGHWQAGQRRLGDVAEQAWHEMDEQLGLHAAAVATLAAQLRMADIGATPAATPWLDVVRGNTPPFTSMIVADPTGRVVASSPDGAVGSDVSDRAYFTEIARGRAVFVSDAFRGRVLGTNAIVGVSAPLTDPDGRFAGIVQGSLQLDRFGDIEARFGSVTGLRLVVLDGAGAVVYGGRDGRYAQLTHVADSLVPGRARAAFTLRDPADGARWSVARAAAPNQPWQVLAMQPVAALLAEFRAPILALVLAALWAALVVLVGVRRVLARAVLPVERLAAAMRDYTVTAPLEPVHMSPVTPAEIVELAQSFEAMAGRAHLVISGLVPICAQCKRIRDEHGEWEPVEEFVSAHSGAEFTHGLCPGCLVDLGFPPLEDARQRAV